MAVLVLVISALGIAAGPAVAAPPIVSVDPSLTDSYQSVTATGTIDPQDHDTYYSFQISTDETNWSLAEYQGPVFSGAGPSPVSHEFAGLVPGTQYFVRLNATNFSEPDVISPSVSFTTPATTPPTVSIDDPTVSSPIAAHFSGEINPGGTDPAFDVKWRFQCNPECPGLDGQVPADNATHQVAIEAKLQPNTAYEVSLIAENAGAQASAGPKSFSSAVQVPPTVATGKAVALGPDAATLYGNVNALGLATTYRFEYGTSTAYGSVVPVGLEALAGAGYATVNVAKGVSGLQPGTTYHYRLVARNAIGTEAGADRTFTTPVAATPTRAYELVSPAEKGGNNVLTAGENFRAAISGEALSFPGQNVLLNNGGEASPYFPRYIAHRTADAWITNPVDPAQGPPRDEATGKFHFTLGVSDDGTKAVVTSLRKLAPGAIEGDSNIYLRDVRSGGMTTIATTPGSDFWATISNTPCCFPTGLVAGTSDFDHLLLASAGYFTPGPSFIPGAPADALYEYSNGQLRVASVTPDDTMVRGDRGSWIDHGLTRISADGSKIFFGSSDTGGVYVRLNGTTTKAMSASHLSGEEGVIKPARYVGASKDGSVAYFFSQDLTDDSVPGAQTLYRYTVGSGQLQMLAQVAGPAEFPGPVPLQVSDDGSSVYLESRAALTPDATPGESRYYVWRNGHLSFIASFKGFEVATAAYWASSNGRYFVFDSGETLTGYNSGPCRESTSGSLTPCRQIYRYDAEAEMLLCASCRPDGALSRDHASIGSNRDEFAEENLVHAVTDEGRVFFDSPEQLVQKDVNAAQDVYEFDGANMRLISPGTDSKAKLAGVGEDGRDVFFTTQDRLVKIDTDGAVDVYDARVGGGIAAQNQGVPSANCFAEDCRGLVVPPPAPPPGGSETSFGPGNVAARKGRCSKGRHRQRMNGKQRCVKQKKAQRRAKNRTNQNRRQGR